MMFIGVDYHPSFQTIAYFVEETGEYDEILQTYSQIEAKQKFSNLLGCELHDANDKCAERLQLSPAK